MNYRCLFFSTIILLVNSYSSSTRAMEIPTKTICETPIQQLIIAAKTGNLEQIKQLAVEKKINFTICNSSDEKGETPLIHAVKNGKIDVVKYLATDMRVNINAQCKNGCTALMWGSARDLPEIVKYLIEEKHADINATSKERDTSFQIASMCGATKVVKYFFERNDFHKKIDGAIALNLAQRSKRNDTIKYLEQEIGVLPKPGDATGVKTIFYNKLANKYLKPHTLEVLAYFNEPITISSNIQSISQNDTIKHVYQLGVMKQADVENCTLATLKLSAEKLGDTEEQHYKANPIFGHTCSYHALKNALVGLMVLYDYDKLVDACNNTDNIQCAKIADFLNSDLENLQQLIPNGFVEHFMESLHAKTLILKHDNPYGPQQELINTTAGLSFEKQYIAQREFDNALGSIMSQRYQLPLGELDNTLSSYNVYQINNVSRYGFKSDSIPSWWDKFGIPTQEHSFANCETLYQNPTDHIRLLKANCLSSELLRIGAFDLLQQIALFRANINYRHAFVLSLNTASSDGFATNFDAMHAVTVILDKRESIVNVIVLESNNATKWAFKGLVFEFLSLFTNEKQYPMNKAYSTYLTQCASHLSGICVESQQKGLPSFQSLVNTYVRIREKCINEKEQEDAYYALFMLGEIEHHYNRAKLRAECGTNKNIFNTIQIILINNGLNPDTLSYAKEEAPTIAEIELHNIIQKIEAQNLVKKMHDLFMNSANKEGDILPKVKQLLAMGVNPNTCYSGFTGLMRSLQFPTIATYLIENGADIEATNEVGITPLMEAAQWGSLDVLKDLIQRNAHINRQDNNGYTALIHAANRHDYDNKKLEIIRFLIDECNADFNMCDNENCSLLMHSAKNDSIDVIKYLVSEKMMSLNLKNNIDYLTKCLHNIQLIDYFIKEHSLNIKNNPNLVWDTSMAAMRMGSTNIIRRLLEHDCGLAINHQDSNGWTLLMHAAEKGAHPMVEDLIAIEGIDLQIKNNEDKTALDIAYEKNYNGIITMLGGTPKPWQDTNDEHSIFFDDF